MSKNVKDTPALSNDELVAVDEELQKRFKDLPLDYWDFVDYEKHYTHDIHNYPAMMIPPIPRELIRIIKECQPNIKNLLDPFMGSGTVLLEGLMANLNVWGVDLNPLACLIAKVKCTPIDPSLLNREKERILEAIIIDKKNFEKGKLNINIPSFNNITYWFKDFVIRDLQIIKQNIKKIKEKKIRDFFWVAFSETVRACSNTRNNEFKLYRMSNEMLKNFNPSVFDVFRCKLEKNIESMAYYYNDYNNIRKAVIMAEDTRNFKLEEKMDLMITSPPYGDSRTTVAYGQFSRLSLQWLDLDGVSDYAKSNIEFNKIDNYLLGGRCSKEKNSGRLKEELPSTELMRTLKIIEKKDRKRAAEVLAFFIDLDSSLKNITSVMKKNSYQCWVIGNRTVKNITIPTNVIISQLGEKYNLKTITNIPRNIPNKRMPKENSPSNVKGVKEKTINKENIVILRKAL